MVITISIMPHNGGYSDQLRAPGEAERRRWEGGEGGAGRARGRREMKGSREQGGRGSGRTQGRRERQGGGVGREEREEGSRGGEGGKEEGEPWKRER